MSQKSENLKANGSHINEFRMSSHVVTIVGMNPCKRVFSYDNLPILNIKRAATFIFCTKRYGVAFVEGDKCRFILTYLQGEYVDLTALV